MNYYYLSLVSLMIFQVALIPLCGVFFEKMFVWLHFPPSPAPSPGLFTKICEAGSKVLHNPTLIRFLEITVIVAGLVLILSMRERERDC